MLLGLAHLILIDDFTEENTKNDTSATILGAYGSASNLKKGFINVPIG